MPIDPEAALTADSLASARERVRIGPVPPWVVAWPIHHPHPGPQSSGLGPPPKRSGGQGAYELQETLLLDTTGEASLLAAVVRATGFHADALRQQFEKRGADVLAKERLEWYSKRFFHAERVGVCHLRDDPEANELVLAEVYEINGFLGAAPDPGACSVPLAGTLLLTALALPEPGDPHGPPGDLALPYPCELIHTIEVHNSALQPFSTEREAIQSPFVRFSRTHRSLMGYWSAAFKLSVLAEAVPADQVADYWDAVEKVWGESNCALMLAAGHARPAQKHAFARLPAPSRKPGPRPELRAPIAPAPRPAGTPPQARLPQSARPKIKRYRRSRARRGRTVLLGVVVIALVVGVLLAVRYWDRLVGFTV